MAALLLLSCAACDNDATDPGENGGFPPGFRLTVQLVTDGLASPVLLTAPDGDPRMFIVQQNGIIRIFENNQLLPTPFLDIRSRTAAGGERGLLGLAFHPDYASNGFFFVNYTDQQGDTRVERYRVSQNNSNVADAASATLVLMIEQPYSNHNGGMILFAPDGMLLVGMGDGGSGGDPQGHGQNRSSLLGKMLRLNVNSLPYSVPPDNPYAGHPSFRPEIWAYGLRNPWRFSIDRATGTLYIGDVGQNRWEEIDAASALTPGLNYGWNIAEGNACYQVMCSLAGLAAPVLAYGRGDGCSVIGGYVYRGATIPEIVGHYFYSDYCQAWLRSFRLSDGEATERRDWLLSDLGGVLSMGEDASGELYILTDRGRVYRIVRGT
jgi:glucose/arabinose dehydrogenase